MQPSNSIEMAIWVAVGGRGTLSVALWLELVWLMALKVGLQWLLQTIGFIF